MGRHDQERQAGPLVPSKGDESATTNRGLEMLWGTLRPIICYTVIEA